MPTTPKSNRRGQEPENYRKNRLKEKALSFHGRITMEVPEARIRRPNTLPDLLGSMTFGGALTTEARPKFTKLLLNITIQGSVGTIQVLMSSESTVSDLIAIAVRQYTKECRRPIIAADPSKFDLHYSQFSLESLDREEKVMALGSRNFFLCAKRTGEHGVNNETGSCSSNGDAVDETTSSSSSSSPSSSCSKEVEKAAKGGSPWLKFMDFLR